MANDGKDSHVLQFEYPNNLKLRFPQNLININLARIPKTRAKR